MKATHWKANVTDDRTIQASALDAHIASPVAVADPIRLTPDDDHYVGTDASDDIRALAGDDIVDGVDGQDRIWGGSGDDGLNGERGKDILRGGTGDDTLNGGSQRDRLFGGDGSDSLNGDVGADWLNGGSGADRIGLGRNDSAIDHIIYKDASDSTSDAFDVIDYFRSGEDKVDLSAIDANSNTPEDDAFTYIGTAAFSGTAGEIRIEHFGSSGLVGDNLLADIDGDGQADLMIQFNLSSTAHILATDIVL